MEIAGEWDSMSPASAIFFILESFKSDPTENQVGGTMSAFGCDHSGVELKEFLVNGASIKLPRSNQICECTMIH
jgi:hypothetical protein